MVIYSHFCAFTVFSLWFCFCAFWYKIFIIIWASNCYYVYLYTIISISDKHKTFITLNIVAGLISSQKTEIRLQEPKSFFQHWVVLEEKLKSFKRKQIFSLKKKKFNENVTLFKFYLLKIVMAELRAHDYIEILNEFLWNKFQKVYELKFKNFIIVAMWKTFPYEIVMVKEFQISENIEKFHILQ